MTTFPQAVDRTAELNATGKIWLEAYNLHRQHYRVEQHITIANETVFPVRYKRVGKPRIKKIEFGIYLCWDSGCWGRAYTPVDAYRAWHRNHFLPAPS